MKRTLARIAERATGTKIVRPHELHTLHEEELLRRFFRHFDVDCVFDVGANRGQYAQRLRERIGFRGPIVSFEPIPHVAAALKQSAAAARDWYVRDVALGAQAGRASFHVMAVDEFSSLRRPNARQAAIFDDANRVVQTADVEVSTLAVELSTFQARLGFRRPFLKLDTQGHDVEVATGAGASLATFVGIQSELAFAPLYEGTPDYHAALRFYAERGFALSGLVPNNAGHFPLLVEMDCILYRADLVPAPR